MSPSLEEECESFETLKVEKINMKNWITSNRLYFIGAALGSTLR